MAWSMVATVSIQESVTNRMGTVTCISRRGDDRGLGGDSVRTIKSLTCTLAALNAPTVMSVPHRSSPSQSMCSVWHGSEFEQQDVDSGGIGLMVPSPMTLFFHELSLLMVTDICRRRYTRRRGFVSGTFLDATVLDATVL